jgi:epidermal growth factor receptor substrate 15
LPQIEGISISSSPRVASPFQNTTDDLYSVTGGVSPAAREKYSRMFQMAHPVNGVLDAESARNIFVKSNLSVDQLAQIWNLADTRRSGALNQTEFVIAMYYIAGIMDASIRSLPESLPPNIYTSAAGKATPASPVARHFSGERSLSPSFMQKFAPSSPSYQKQAPVRHFTGSPLQSSVNLSTPSPFPTPSAAAPQWDVTDQEKQKYDTYFDRIDSRKTGVIQGNCAYKTVFCRCCL